MKKRYFSALALYLALNTTSAYTSAKDGFDSEKSGASKRLPVDVLAADKPEEAVKVAQTQNDLSEFLKIEIASAIKSHYPFLATQVEILRTLGVDPVEKCNPLLVKAYCDEKFLANNLETISVSGFNYKTFPYTETLINILRDSLGGENIEDSYVGQNISPSCFPFVTYQKIEAHIKAKFEEFVVMVLGEPLADKKDGKSEVK